MATVDANIEIRLGSEDEITCALRKDDGVTPIGDLTSIVVDWVFLLAGAEVKRFSTSGSSPKVSIVSAALAQVQLSQLRSDFTERANYLHYWILYGTDSVTLTDQALGDGDGAQTVFDLNCLHIVSASDTIKLDAVSQTRGVDYTIDNDTGIITFTSPVGDGVVVTADYQYLKPRPVPDSKLSYRFDVQ